MPKLLNSIILHLHTVPSSAAVINFLKNQHPNTNFSNYPDLIIYNPQADSFKIDIVRQIIKNNSYAAYSDQQRFCVLLHADLATIPAQNALLKLIEEPPAQTQIILAVKQIHKLLPTIQSRCQIIRISDQSKKTNPSSKKQAKNQQTSPNQSKTASNSTMADFKQSLNSYSAIIDFVEKRKDRQQAFNLIQELIEHYQQKISINQSNITIIKALLESYNQLEQNVNVRLALEDCFFKIKQLTGY